MGLYLTPILLSVLAGLCLGGAWWLYVDGVIVYHQYPHYNATHASEPLPYDGTWVIPGLVTTVAIVVMNCVTIQQVRQHWEGRLWLFVTLTISFLGLSGGVWILTRHFGGNEWSGITIVLQCVLCLLAGVIYFLRMGLGGDGSYMLHL